MATRTRILARLLGALIGTIGVFLTAWLCGTPLPDYGTAITCCAVVLTVALLELRYRIW
jgi:hypothetical protein